MVVVAEVKAIGGVDKTDIKAITILKLRKSRILPGNNSQNRIHSQPVETHCIYPEDECVNHIYNNPEKERINTDR